MKFAVIGTGNGGKAVSAYLLNKGHEVVLYGRNPELTAALQAEGLTSTGAVEGHFDITATSDLAAAVKGAKVILVQTVATGHAPVAENLKGLLEPGQVIVIFNGNWGAAEFSAILGEEAKEKGVDICETAAQLFLCASPSATSVKVNTVKQGIAIACTDVTRTAAVMETLDGIFPLTAGANVIDTSINGSNPVVHGPIATFNITRMENGESYTLFGTALPQKTVDYIEKIDAERCAVAEAIGIKSISVLDILNSFWPDKAPNVYGALKENKAYEGTPGPKTINHRYLEEDLPYGLVPLVRLGNKFGVDTPYLDALVTVLGMYLGRDYLTEGPAVEGIDFAGLLG